MLILFCISSSAALAQERLPADTHDPNRSETPQTVEDPCSQKNILANIEIAKAMLTLYGEKKAEDVQFNDTVWEWAESTDALLFSCGSRDDAKLGASLVRNGALEIERLFLLSVFASLSKENQALRGQVQQLSAHTQAAADTYAEAQRANADSRRALALAILGRLGQTKPYQLPPPLQFSSPATSVHCVTRYIGQTAYTDCR